MSGTLYVDKMLVPETECTCGGKFMVVLLKGDRAPHVMHKRPDCGDRRPAFAALAKAGHVTQPSPPKPNRRQRRAQLAIARRQG